MEVQEEEKGVMESAETDRPDFLQCLPTYGTLVATNIDAECDHIFPKVKIPWMRNLDPPNGEYVRVNSMNPYLRSIMLHKKLEEQKRLDYRKNKNGNEHSLYSANSIAQNQAQFRRKHILRKQQKLQNKKNSIRSIKSNRGNINNRNNGYKSHRSKPVSSMNVKFENSRIKPKNAQHNKNPNGNHRHRQQDRSRPKHKKHNNSINVLNESIIESYAPFARNMNNRNESTSNGSSNNSNTSNNNNNSNNNSNENTNDTDARAKKLKRNPFHKTLKKKHGARSRLGGVDLFCDDVDMTNESTPKDDHVVHFDEFNTCGNISQNGMERK